MDLTRATAQEIGTALDVAGMTWSVDDDGDVRVRFRSTAHPWTDAVFYELTPDFSMRGQFLNARQVQHANGALEWQVPADSGHNPTAVAQKVVTVYLMPRQGHVGVQIHAAISPLSDPRPMRIRVIPGSAQVRKIESEFPGFVGTEKGTELWISTGLSGTRVSDAELGNFVQTAAQVGLAMFEGPFTGWLQRTDL